MTTSGVQLDRVAELSRDLVQRAGAIALAANDDIDSGTFDHTKCAKSMLDLLDVGLAGGLELGPLMCSPCTPCLPEEENDDEHSGYLFAIPDPQNARTIAAVPGSFKHDGDPHFVIPDDAISFEPPVLKPLAEQYRICVAWDALRSGTYHGTIRLVPESGTAAATEEPVTVDL